MADDLDRERFEFEKKKAAQQAELDEMRFALDKEKLQRENRFLSRNLGVVIAFATTVLGLTISAAQVWVAYIQQGREELHRQKEFAQASSEKSREFDFAESKDLREFVINHQAQINASDAATRQSIKDLMLLTYRPEVVGPVVARLQALSPPEQQGTWKQASADLAKISSYQMWCYQEKHSNGTYGAYCHSLPENCEAARAGSRTATACVQVQGLSLNGWNAHGLLNSWYQLNLSSPLPPPLPQPQ